MGRALRSVCLLVVAVLSLPRIAYGQQTDSSFVLRLPATVRAAGFNGAAVALVGDAGSVFANPAGLATIPHIALEGAFRPALSGAYVVTGALGWRLGQFDVGFGGRFFDYGTKPDAFAPVPLAAGEGASEALAVGSLVYRFGLFAVGASGKYLRQRMGSAVTTGTSMDAGLAIAFFDIMAIAFSMQNIGGNWVDTASIAMPRLTRVGFTMNYVDPQETFRLLSTLEVQWVQGRGARGVIGGEAGVVLSGIGLIGRAAYGGRSGLSTTSTVTYGGTLAIGRFQFDYAYNPSDILGKSVHLLGLRLRL